MFIRLGVISICVLLLAACAPISAPVLPIQPAATQPLAATPTASPVAAPGASGAVGYLAGRVTVGPLQPVERVGAPSPIPPPEVFTSRSINIFKGDGATLVVNVKFNGDGTYRVALPPGVYVVALARTGIDRARELPVTITIESGKTVTLDIGIDTGMR
ncbi:MAG TPA: hypothetical protein VF429_04865 [Anaerolineae bacterium]